MSSTLCADAPSPKKKKQGGRDPLLGIFFFFFFLRGGSINLYTGSMSSSQSEEQMYMKLVQPSPLIYIP